MPRRARESSTEPTTPPPPYKRRKVSHQAARPPPVRRSTRQTRSLAALPQTPELWDQIVALASAEALATAARILSPPPPPQSSSPSPGPSSVNSPLQVKQEPQSPDLHLDSLNSSSQHNAEAQASDTSLCTVHTKSEESVHTNYARSPSSQGQFGSSPLPLQVVEEACFSSNSAEQPSSRDSRSTDINDGGYRPSNPASSKALSLTSSELAVPSPIPIFGSPPNLYTIALDGSRQPVVPNDELRNGGRVLLFEPWSPPPGFDAHSASWPAATQEEQEDGAEHLSPPQNSRELTNAETRSQPLIDQQLAQNDHSDLNLEGRGCIAQQLASYDQNSSSNESNSQPLIYQHPDFLLPVLQPLVPYSRPLSSHSSGSQPRIDERFLSRSPPRSRSFTSDLSTLRPSSAARERQELQWASQPVQGDLQYRFDPDLNEDAFEARLREAVALDLDTIPGQYQGLALPEGSFDGGPVADGLLQPIEGGSRVNHHDSMNDTFGDYGSFVRYVETRPLLLLEANFLSQAAREAVYEGFIHTGPNHGSDSHSSDWTSSGCSSSDKENDGGDVR